jgi:hypothetical protein
MAHAAPVAPCSSAEKNSSALASSCAARPTIDAARDEHRPALGRDLEGLVRRALGGELEDSRAIGVQPHLGHQPPTALAGGLQLQLEDRAVHRQVVEGDAVGRVLGEEGPLRLGEQLAHRALAADGRLDGVRRDLALRRRASFCNTLRASPGGWELGHRAK